MEHVARLGMREIYGEPVFFGLSEIDRLQHLYLIGKSGSGKTTLMRNLLIADIEAGRGVAFIDPHGDEAERLLDEIPASRADDIVYLDAADQEHPVALNLLQAVAPSERSLVANNVVATFSHLWADFWGPQSEYVLLNAVLALLEFPIEKGGATLLGISRLLTDEDYRAWVLSYVRSEPVLRFWQAEFAGWSEKKRNDAVAPLENKAGRLQTPTLRGIFGQVKSTIKPRTIMDEGKILIANLAKGKIGAGDCNLVGSIIVTAFELAAHSRADMPEEDRRSFYLFADEFHNFTTKSFASSLSELRKYGLSLALAHQYLEQIDEDIRAAVLGNVGSLVCFRVGADDAAALSREFVPYPPETLRALGRGEVCVRLLRDGEPTDAFMGRTLPPLRRGYARRATLLRQSRERYGVPREKVEAKLQKWFSRGREW